MKLENQVTSLELSKRLKELGVKQESLFYWYISNDKKETILTNGSKLPVHLHYDFEKCCSAFTSGELGELMPYKITDNIHIFLMTTIKTDTGWMCLYIDDIGNQDGETFEANTEADARAKMLISLIEQGIVTV